MLFNRALLLFFFFMIGCNLSTPNREALRIANKERDLSCIISTLEIPPHPLSLIEVIEIAVWNNLDLLVKEYEYEFQSEEAARLKMTLLPTLETTWNLTARNNLNASFSRSLSNIPPAPPSTSETKTVQFLEARLTWDILNFGITYFRAKQESNKAIQKCLDYERTYQNLVMEIVKRYYFISALTEGIKKAEEWLERSQKQLDVMERLIGKQVLSLIPGLIRKGTVYEMDLRLAAYRKDRDLAKLELSQMMGVPPSIPFEIEAFHEDPLLSQLPPIDELENIALANRPELYGGDLEEKNQQLEVKRSIAEMFPHLELFFTDNYNNNFFLINKYWYAAGVRAAWDLLQIPAKEFARRGAVKNVLAARSQRLVLSLGVLSQLHMAIVEYEEQKKLYQLAKEYHDVEQRLFEGMTRGQSEGLFNLMDVMDVEAKTLASEVEYLRLYSSCLAALEKINNSLGLPLYLLINDVCLEECLDG